MLSELWFRFHQSVLHNGIRDSPQIYNRLSRFIFKLLAGPLINWQMIQMYYTIFHQLSATSNLFEWRLDGGLCIREQWLVFNCTLNERKFPCEFWLWIPRSRVRWLEGCLVSSTYIAKQCGDDTTRISAFIAQRLWLSINYQTNIFSVADHTRVTSFSNFRDRNNRSFRPQCIWHPLTKHNLLRLCRWCLNDIIYQFSWTQFEHNIFL